ncbi:sulfatase domain-containing protein [Verticillium dahliae VdLs.17]|uniref:Sulfatase domain-containing protein n=1 Tax=Verticillium dahliae (strain VdLs.17 / ATCC MYA-4575 / FGSC 10137) TaxID=498257 RepID=G2XI68_VERDV|nr:sulfatase domain-containing protein [Verticillium dahliae VdLs.17]EGY19516.1 sulfatase domain-containing protein [Verticillium dahliae VdLs.17]KAH6701829.1 sulfatase domain-containing protein [Verticillium dahliae]
MHLPVVSLLFAALCTSLFLTKLILLLIHAPTIPVASALFYLPTFFLPDFLVICVARLALRREKGPLRPACRGVVVVGAASSTLGFFYETGSELEWHSAATFAFEKEARDVLLSGLLPVTASALFILSVAWFTHQILYKAVGDFLIEAGYCVVYACKQFLKSRQVHDVEKDAESSRSMLHNGEGEDNNGQQPNAPADIDSDDSDDWGNPPELRETKSSRSSSRSRSPQSQSRPSRVPSWRLKAAALGFLAFAMILRPHKPFDHMSVTLPVAMLDMFSFSGPPRHSCMGAGHHGLNNWPLPELTEKSRWKMPKGNFKGWAPGDSSPMADAYQHRVVDWAHHLLTLTIMARPAMAYPGILRLLRRPLMDDPVEKGHLGHPGIILLHLRLLDARLQISSSHSTTLLDKDEVKIKHVVFILMESLRSEVFPIRPNTNFHDMIVEANEEEMRDEIKLRLAQMTPNIAKITGYTADFEGIETPPVSWAGPSQPGYGGINVVGALTSSTMSTKSYSANLCGTWPMAVEKFDEADTDAYQPCLPQILSLFNRDKDGSGKPDPASDFRQQKWRPALFEAMTETFDRQDKFDKKIGFQHIVTEKQLKADTSRYKPLEPLYEKVNYFGFAEPVLVPYLKDYINETAANNERMFMMHFTSSTHHPWVTPKAWNTTDYFDSKGIKHRDLNKFLQTVNYHDAWMGNLMQLFEETGIANETLVVFAGDHGQAFKEDCKRQGTFENGHISNFRIPIVFSHPHLPRIEYEANATSLSILPTILDLLINTGSLNKHDSSIASDLVHDYEGQSLIRPYKTADDGRRAWNFSVVNSGAGMLSITSADTTWRLLLPLVETFDYKMSDLQTDPTEQDVLSAWSLKRLVSAVRKKHGESAADWVKEAEIVAQWWMKERRRLWRHS